MATANVEDGIDRLTSHVARQLKALRTARGYSLDDLAGLCGVSRATLSQIEANRTNPTLAVLWKIANGLGVPFSELLGAPPSDDAIRVLPYGDNVIRSADGLLSSLPLTPGRALGPVDLYELELQPSATHLSEAHPTGTRECIVVLAGQLEIEVRGERVRVNKREVAVFPADEAHAYHNPTSRPARALNVIVFPER